MDMSKVFGWRTALGITLVFFTAIAFAGGIMLWRKRKIGLCLSLASLLFAIAINLHTWENLFSVTALQFSGEPISDLRGLLIERYISRLAPFVMLLLLLLGWRKVYRNK
jgi:hypothetical protein